MKIQILDISGKPVKEAETSLFDSPVRQDIVSRIAEVEKINELKLHPYAPFYLAGQQTSASGNVRHKRHSWKSDRGRGMARIPKKRMSRRGERFIWEGAVIPGTRGGRRAHPPKLAGALKKINKKEMLLGLKSALAIAANAELVQSNYLRLKNMKININLPIVVENKMLALKTKDFISALQKVLGAAADIGLQKKRARAGKGTMRGRRYKKSAGALLVIGNKENKKSKGIDIVKAGKVRVSDLASNGARFVVFTEQAVKELEERTGGLKAK